MPESLAERLRAAHQQRFVGRADELARFEHALGADDLPFAVLYVHGPGGIGKTALLQEMQYRCADRDVAVHHLDARHVEPTSDAVRDALQQAGLPLSDGTASAERSVLFVDTFEALAPLHPWVRETLIPHLPASCLVVLSGRTPPPPAWRSDLRLEPLLATMPLRNLPRAQSQAYLDRRALPDRHTQAILDFAHGHPLALSLAADAALQAPETPFSPVDAPDLVGTLVQRFLERVPSARHRRALEACALVRVLTEPLLARLLDADGAHDLFQWLRDLSFIESGTDGLFPHDIVRTALVADLRWRDADAFQALQQRAREHYLSTLDAATDAPSPTPDAQRILSDHLFLFRHNPVVRPFFQRLREEWNAQSPPVRDAASEDDAPALQAMVADHEGTASAALFEYWWTRQPDGVQVFRAPDGSPVGFVFPLALEATTPADRERDPAVAAAWTHLDAEAPLREGETATLFRFWMARDAYQDISPVQSLISAYRVRYYLTTPHLAYTFIPAADPDRWKLLFAYADLHQIDGASFTVGGTTYGLFGHDWRVMPPRAWLELLAERDLSTAMPPSDPSRGPRMLVLSRSDFDDAVKSAFKAYSRPEALHGHPLLRARLIADTAGLDADVNARIEALRALLCTAAEQLQQDPKTAKYYRALRATYLEPQPTQERAAEHLDLPFSTYRRYLKRGIEHVADSLWRREIGDA